MNRNYEDNWWDCTGRYKIDNFRLYCLSMETTGICEAVAGAADDGDAYNLMGIRLKTPAVHGIYIRNGKKYVK